jgi:hypothetical protein
MWIDGGVFLGVLPGAAAARISFARGLCEVHSKNFTGAGASARLDTACGML